MKKLFFAFLILFFSGMTISFAQDQNPSRIREFGLTFSNLNSFGVRFKTGNQKTLLRFTALVLNLQMDKEYGRTQDSIDNKITRAGVGLQAGFEKHIRLTDNFNLILGSDIGLNYNYDKTDYKSSYYSYNTRKSTSWEISPSIAFVFGVAYHVGQHIVISAEVTPSLSYSYGKNTTKNTYPYNPTETVTTINNFGFGFGNSPASITLAYRFLK